MASNVAGGKNDPFWNQKQSRLCRRLHVRRAQLELLKRRQGWQCSEVLRKRVGKQGLGRANLQMLPVPEAIPERFPFSVRDKAVVAKINAAVGKKVTMSYEQHKGTPTTLFGESGYFIVDVKALE
ncbi:hypothetical protein [Geomonas agri]|uniref:hypothetical protein n=1 Tax=Geomonas agri TaxID=2873702 RepID=UPI001CD788C4|nr:hypothetical protein [Geomonas agri]